MIAFALIAVLTSQPVSAEPPMSAAEYFPLKEGMSWDYEDTLNGQKDKVHDLIGAPRKLDSLEPVFPLVSVSESSPQETTYYHVDGNTVFTVAYDDGKPLSKPLPILILDTKKREWTYKGTVQFMRGKANLEVNASSEPGPEETFLGTKYPTYVVRFDATMTTDIHEIIKTSQQLVYGKGIGLMKFAQDATAGDQRMHRERKLLFFDPGKPGQ